jgi:hypothetical protein
MENLRRLGAPGALSQSISEFNQVIGFGGVKA